MNNKIEESTPTQVNQSFMEFHDILDRSNPTIAKQTAGRHLRNRPWRPHQTTRVGTNPGTPPFSR